MAAPAGAAAKACNPILDPAKFHFQVNSASGRERWDCAMVFTAAQAGSAQFHPKSRSLETGSVMRKVT